MTRYLDKYTTAMRTNGIMSRVAYTSRTKMGVYGARWNLAEILRSPYHDAVLIFNYTNNGVQYTMSAPLYTESTQADLINLRLRTPPEDYSKFPSQSTDQITGQIVLTGVFDA